MGDVSERYDIQITKDGMTATLVEKTRKEDELETENATTVEQLLEFIKEQGVVYGVQEQQVISYIEDPQTNSLPIVVAEGKPPINGEKAYLLPVQLKTEQKEQVLGNQTVDLKQVIDIPTVSEGDLVGEKIEATAGIPGMNVLGEKVEQKPGKDIQIRPGKNTRISEDGLKLFSLVDGQVSVEKKLIHVYPNYEVNGDVNMKTGNISFVGNVTIRGNVPTGFSVSAKGDIRIYGTVEGAILEAGGSIFVTAGIVAQDSGNIKAGQDLHTTFVNQANVNVGGDLHVGQAILHSRCSVGGTIFCEKGKGSIVGGQLSAAKGIHAVEIGNSMHSKTALFIGVDQTTLEKEKTLQEAVKKASDELEKLEKLLNAFAAKEKAGIALAPNERIMKLRVRNTIVQTEQTLQDAKEELEDMIENKEDNEFGTLTVKKTIFPNVSVTFGKYRRKIKSPHQYVKFALVDGEIKLLPM
ncbi:DUF342 domain-containing protein [Alkalihalobacterium bogoriense]|uniref:DUF342 domain-containing protein n=1 Tax=Alkalihalobacterium bogoriense TaxID=246272 RepID=UPI00047AF617|nr:FapA family protein [Alkalihalobacterium bogoriense]